MNHDEIRPSLNLTKHSDYDLKEIIKNPGQYRDHIREAAIMEIQRRGLGVDHDTAHSDTPSPNKPVFIDKFLSSSNSWSSDLLQALNIQNTKINNPMLLLMIIGFGLILWDIYQVISSKFLLEAWDQEQNVFAYLSLLLSILLILMPCIAAILLVMKKKLGWFLVMLIAVKTIIFEVLSELLRMYHRFIGNYPFNEDIQVNDSNFNHLVKILACSIILYWLTRDDLKTKFSITEKDLKLSLILGLAFYMLSNSVSAMYWYTHWNQQIQ